MSLTGGCHCGEIRYELQGEPLHGGQALCHCSDCRRAAGAPLVGWAMFPEDALTVLQGQAREYASSDHGRRWFCPTCGSGLFYRNQQNLPGLVDIQAATLDDPMAIPAVAHIQVAERVDWMREAHQLPVFDRFPGP
ncbi:GFA family protein [Sphingomonas turrisvirgatae]|uniref:Aldehyde-activating protein n=1 Tax=Sphingomonas turrisvirgatae TaxID=1888892 RepID=A0A1E3LUW9_9SPHN|nr:GFA family protein [Sphingomonas turrisvirgatae]ODP37552.1 aldehyde-activating protein [Sphingomonas turrisvirgatae]